MNKILEYMGYLLYGIQFVWEEPYFRYTIIFLLSAGIFVLVRRWLIVHRSGGGFFTPFHVADGIFYIHNAFVPGRRAIPLKDIKSIDVYFVRGFHFNGSRWRLAIHKRKGKSLIFFVGQSKANDRLIRGLSKNKIKVHFFLNG